jgi:N-acetylglutamate synthase-like GNAT family acetyltransferase
MGSGKMSQNEMKVTFRTMKVEDLPAVLALINAEGWEYDLSDVSRILEIDPEDSVSAISCGEIVGGTTVACHIGRGVLGHVVVKDGWRKKGIGKSMMIKVIEKLDAKGIAIIELYSVPHAVEFYRQLGFHKIGDLMIFVGSIKTPVATVRSNAEIGDLTARDLERVKELDRRIVGFDRGNIIEKLMLPNLRQSVGLFEEGKLIGFALGRLSADSAEIGPWIMERPNKNDAAALFTAAMDRVGNRKTFIEVPDENKIALRIVVESGLNPQYPVQRFVRTKLDVKPFGPGVMSYAALEYG